MNIKMHKNALFHGIQMPQQLIIGSYGTNNDDIRQDDLKRTYGHEKLHK